LGVKLRACGRRSTVSRGPARAHPVLTRKSGAPCPPAPGGAA
jgi:hypothetical protein